MNQHQDISGAIAAAGGDPFGRETRIARFGHWMRQHAKAIRTVQWGVALVYGMLVFTPVLMPLPVGTVRLWNDLLLAAKFVFWGLWWPFVLLSMVFVGRVWCGVLCPEGMLSELASKYGRGRAIPRWMRWGGWPFVAFALTAVYGQMISVHDYPEATLLVLGSSTCSAVLVGYLYGREKRVWCRYLCPVKGVFSLLARLAPLHYRVDEAAWRASYATGAKGYPVIAINCAPLVAIRNMKGSAECHMCSRCSGYRSAVALSWRSPSDEIVVHGDSQASRWDTALILYGLLGVAIGAFHWTVSPWFAGLQHAAADWLRNRHVLWPLQANAPWYLLTHDPDHRHAFSWLHGVLGIVYIAGTALVYGTSLLAVLALGARMLGPWRASRLHHLSQALIPLAGTGLFTGSLATTLAVLHAVHIDLRWATDARMLILALATLWSAWLGVRVVRRYEAKPLMQAAAWLFFAVALAIADSAWWLLLWHWTKPFAG